MRSFRSFDSLVRLARERRKLTITRRHRTPLTSRHRLGTRPDRAKLDAPLEELTQLAVRHRAHP
jgi:hypothetical protein